MGRRAGPGERRRQGERPPRGGLRGPAILVRHRVGTQIALSVLLGAGTGLGVTVLHLVMFSLTWERLSRLGDWWVALLPIGALAASSAILELTHDRSTDTTEAYIRVFHDPRANLRARVAPLRLLASTATIALGGSMGLEGPSIYLGAVLGDLAERWLSPVFDREDAKMMLVAGAAAGIGAIFKAPVTGIIFALEVPYRDDLARHALIPAIFASATSYLTFVSLVGTRPLFPVQAAPLRLEDLGGSLLVGVGCGVAARLFVFAYRGAVRLARRMPFGARAIAGGAVAAAAGGVALAVYHLPLPLGPGYNGILRAARGQLGWTLLLALLALKIVSTSATAAGNGVGGLFFPSVMMGAAAGGAIGHVVPGPASLFAVVGIAAFLGGAYKVPLAGVAFVAETTGAPGYIIPGLLAAALGYLVSGRGSISARQRFRRRSELESRLDLRVDAVMAGEWTEVPPTTTLREFVSGYAMRARAKTLPVAEEGRYAGMIALDDLQSVPPEQWDARTVAEVAVSREAAEPGWPLARALRLMRREGVDRLAVVSDGRIVGMVSTSDVLRVEEILDTVGEHERQGLEV